MTEVVLDASVVWKWIAPASEPRAEQARLLVARYRAGELRVTVPGLIFWELINVAGRRWSWPAEELTSLAAFLGELEFDVVEPDLVEVARWTSVGLTAYDACYVALAEHIGAALVTDDESILSAAGDLASPLSAVV